MPAPDRIKQLIETFEQNIAAYHSQKNETELRRQFLDPFFEALGWDVDNKKGYDERSKEVAHEYSVEIDGVQKKADYAFRTGRDSFDFLVEAKKPSVKIESNLDAAFQIRRYGWSAGLPINILTDFEHFAMYDCRTRPNYSKDKVGTGLLQIIHYKDYIKRWDEIAGLFSPDAIRKGALDSYKDQLKGKKGTQEVDDAFLEEIEAWRETLAKNIALRNKEKNLTEEQINFAVQMTIDRIIFLRIAEERGMEKDRRLFEQTESANVYQNLRKLFEQADARYNSGLFHFKREKDRENPDTLTPTLDIDDKVLKDIIKDLYYPSPYAFNYIPADILGSVYERFLGKVIRLTADRNAKVDEKPEVRKAGGVYYTPTYIVDYIVKNTVGKLLEGKTPEEVSRIKIVDPACGSGSFLLGAYQFLLDWHLDRYANHDLEKSLKKKILLTADNKTYRLSLNEKKRILLNNLHGVDIDPQAVEVTKLSLLLKVVEDPGQLTMFEEGHILPNLNKNIKNGNALIGTDYFSGQMFGDMDEMKRVKPFEWKDEFPEVFKRGGFDVVIGNPPYIQLSMADYYNESVNNYFGQIYSSSMGRLNTFGLFIERVLNSVLAKKGLFSFIVPNTLLTQEYYQGLRKQILNYQVIGITNYKYPVFKDAVVETIMFVIRNSNPIHHKVEIVDFDNNSMTSVAHDIAQEVFLATHNNSFLVTSDAKTIRFKTTLDNKGVQLGKLANLNQAIALKHDRSKSLFMENRGANYKPVLDGRNINRYETSWNGQYLAYDVKNIHSCKRTDIFEADEKLFFRRVGDRLIATYDNKQFYALNTLVAITPREQVDFSLKYLLGLINSNLLNFYYVKYLKSTKKVFSEIQARQLAQLPIRALNLDDPAEKAMHDKMVALVQQMLSLHKNAAREGASSNEIELLERQIKSTDRQIDELVYQLYGLTPEEIKIVEGG